MSIDMIPVRPEEEEETRTTTAVIKTTNKKEENVVVMNDQIHNKKSDNQPQTSPEQPEPQNTDELEIKEEPEEEEPNDETVVLKTSKRPPPISIDTKVNSVVIKSPSSARLLNLGSLSNAEKGALEEDIRQRRLARKRKTYADDDDDDLDNDNDTINTIGTRVGEGHRNYQLMYDMLTGIRIAVGRVCAKMERPLTPDDFTAAHKLVFDITGNELTPGVKYDFKFKDYAPWVFRYLRDKFHVDAADYMMSLTHKYILSEITSPGKSGSFFYYSRDYRFIIKTIHHSEHKFMRKILADYYKHVSDNPNTLLCRFYGLHRIKLPRGRKIHFVVMGNVLPSNKDIHETFDLKGSLFGRLTSEEEVKKNPRSVMKDQNWVDRHEQIQLGPHKRSLLLTQLERDVEILQKLNIMDYSLLVGIHDLRKGNIEGIRDHLQMVTPRTEALERRFSYSTASSKDKADIVRRAVRHANSVHINTSDLPKSPSEE